MSLVLLATFTVRADCRDRIEGVIRRSAPQVRATEPGVLLYQLARSKEQTGVYRMWEIYADKAAVEAHATTPYLLAEIDELMACQAAPPVIEFLDPVAVP